MIIETNLALDLDQLYRTTSYAYIEALILLEQLDDRTMLLGLSRT